MTLNARHLPDLADETTAALDTDVRGQERPDLQAQVRQALRTVAPKDFTPEEQAEQRVQFLVDYLRRTRARGLVLGISGGVDSTTAGRLSQIACLRAGATFTAMRLPYGTQSDEQDAQTALAFIDPDEVLTVDIRPAVDALAATLSVADPAWRALEASSADFHTGNIRARVRMVAQYAAAASRGALVVGTDQAAEAATGWFTKWGDGAVDLAPLDGLTKGQVRALAAHLGAPSSLVAKVPTADLEVLRPGLADEDALGLSYEDIDAYLEGRAVSSRATRLIEERYLATMHKRQLPAVP